MADFLDFLPLYVRTEDDIRTDMDIDVNAGLAPEDPDWVDTRPINFFHMVTQPFVIEAARIHDQIATLPAISFVEFAFGIYLDYHAAALRTERIAAIQATAHVQFKGEVGALITSGTRISTEQTDPNVPPTIFRTTQSGTINGPLMAPVGLTIAAGGGGGLPAGDHYFMVTSFDAAGETTASAEVHVVVPGGGGDVTIGWTADPNALGYRVYHGTVSLAEHEMVEVTANGLIADGTQIWTPATLPVVNTTGGAVLLPAQALDAGEAGNVGPNALTQVVTTNQLLASVTNPLEAENGADVENDADLRQRLIELRGGEGPGRQNDYVRWLGEQGVPRVQVFPYFNGPGTVGVLVMDENGGPLSAASVAAYQSAIDPYPGLGGGIAPIDHIVTIMTPNLVLVNIAAVVAFRPGYSYDGVSNTIPIRQDIIDAFVAYFAALPAGEAVLHDHLLSIFYSVEGVYSVTMTAPVGDTAVSGSSTPPQRGALGTLTLT